MNIAIRHDNDDTAWDEFVAGHEGSTNYHQSGWRQVIEKSFGHKTHYLAARNKNGKICGVLPLVHMKSSLFGSFLVSLPFFNYGGLLSDDTAVTNAFIVRSRQLLKDVSADHAEFRHLAMLDSNLETKQHKVTMILEMERDEETQWKVLDAKVRNQVRKAQKNGLQTVIGHHELLDGFYEVFCRNMRDLGTPVYGKSFFRNILDAFPDTTRIISVTLNGKTIASGILTWFRTTMEVPWASSVRDFREWCPNNLLYWEAIRFAIRHGFNRFDFGRSTPGEGTFNFKKQWGAQPVQLYWQYLLNGGAAMPQLNPSNPKYRMAIKMWQRLPMTVANIFGPGIVRNIP